MRKNQIVNRQKDVEMTKEMSVQEDERMSAQTHECHVGDQQIEAALCDVMRTETPLGRMPLNRWAIVSLWALRIYVLAMLLLVAFKFVQSAALP